MKTEEEDELHDGYWYNGESAGGSEAFPPKAPKPVKAPRYRWVGSACLDYMRLSNEEIVCTISTFGGYYARYPIMKNFGSLDAARRAVEEHFGK